MPNILIVESNTADMCDHARATTGRTPAQSYGDVLKSSGDDVTFEVEEPSTGAALPDLANWLNTLCGGGAVRAAAFGR